MKRCPNCGANVEGLLYRCDCCGATLPSINPTVFVHHTSTMAAAGKLSSDIKRILDKLNDNQIYKYFPQLDKIVFEMYCYPNDMLSELHIHDKRYVSLARKKAIITKVVCYSDFTIMDERQRKAMLSAFVTEALILLYKKIGGNGNDELQLELRRILG